MRILDLVEAVAPAAATHETGIRPGEKLHEEMITETDALSTVELDRYYVILPATPQWDTDKFIRHFGGKPVPLGFHYNSANNDHWLSVEEIREEIRLHVDPEFTHDC
jgi:FlaA1/EpsC-like NDP-sugar epimerase